ncbi:MAG: DNA mismatch repair endonuclease MutL [Anaerolineae bacterium]|nr:DNA mismatch repair endonuclease MutL [Anaerolineae bacterium]
MTIRLLSEDVAARIAAGEVVERPASVVKELVENSLDAGATRIEVETREGGCALLRVRDNGCGIRASEMALAFRRHATSKLETAEDLERIQTLGFRGEALASIASVSKLTCTTRHVEETVGARLRLEGGQIASQTGIGWPRGTEILVEDLFYNVPARRKFLHSERTERRHIDAFLTRYAIAYPHIGFYLAHDGREIFSTSGGGAAKEALLSVYGMELGASLLEIPPQIGAHAEQSVTVGGFVGPTGVHRADRGYITLFVNGRWIEDLRLTYAIIQAYHTLLPGKRYPVAFVTITMPAEDVDVNVHPAKTEVRFRDGDALFRIVQRAVRTTVVEEAPAAASWEAPYTPANDTHSGDAFAATRSQLAALTPAQPGFRQPGVTQTAFTLTPGAATSGESSPQIPPITAGTPMPSTQTRGSALPPAVEPRQTLPPLRVIGQVATMYIIAEGPDGLYLIDQHAAHERVLYEQLLREHALGQIPSQPLLEPQMVSLAAGDAQQLEALMPDLQSLGLEVEPFGPGAIIVRAVPAILQNAPLTELLADIAASEPENTPIHTEREARIVRRICKRIAVKAGQVLSMEEMNRLIRDLEQTDNPRTCPHGRPTILQISVEQLARQFGRLG